MSAELDLAYATLRLRITSSKNAPLDWLKEFLTPAFDSSPNADARVRQIAMTFDEAAFAHLTRSQPKTADEIDCFTLDRRFSRFPCWVDASGRRVIHDRRGETFIEGDRGSLNIAAAADTAHTRLALLRVVRELATVQALRLGWAHLHASAVETRDRIIVFAGPRRSGKSTMLLHALASGEAKFLTNDRLFVNVDAGPLSARAMPTIAKLRDETIEEFPDVSERLAGRGFKWSRTKAESARAATDGPPDLSPAQLCAVMNVTPISSGRLGAIVLPRFEPDVAPTVRVLSPSEAAHRVRASLFLASVPERVSPAFDSGASRFERDDDALCALARSLADHVPCLELSLHHYRGDSSQLAERARVWKTIVGHTFRR